MDANNPRTFTPRPAVVKMNSNLLYVVTAILVLVGVVAVIALKNQGVRSRDPDARYRTQPDGERWYAGIPEYEAASAQPIELPPQTISLPPPQPISLPSPQAQTFRPQPRPRQENAWGKKLRAAYERALVADVMIYNPSRSQAEQTSGQPDTGTQNGRHDILPPADGAGRDPQQVLEIPSQYPPSRPAQPVMLASADTPSFETDADLAQRRDSFGRLLNRHEEHLATSVRYPASPYEVQAGSVIPAVLLTGLNSELPGQVTAQVRETVYDTVTGRYPLIPQGTRLIGLYASDIAFGQRRLLVNWKRLVFPNGMSLSIPDMPGTGPAGMAGFDAQVDNHYLRTFGSALLLSIISAGTQLSQERRFDQDFDGQRDASSVASAALGQELGRTSAEVIRRNLRVPPTLSQQPGYPFNIMVTKDLILPGPYTDADGHTWR